MALWERPMQGGIYTAVPYDVCTLEGLDVNVVADDSEYIEELTRGIANRMTERGLRSGKILVYGIGTAGVYEKIQTAIAQYYPQFQVTAYERTSQGQAAVEELSTYLLYNRDIKGMYAVDTASAPLAVEARNQAIRLFPKRRDPFPYAGAQPCARARAGAYPKPRVADPDFHYSLWLWPERRKSTLIQRQRYLWPLHRALLRSSGQRHHAAGQAPPGGGG